MAQSEAVDEERLAREQAEAFIAAASVSSSASYSELKKLLARLDTPSERQLARRVLGLVKQLAPVDSDESRAKLFFWFHRLTIAPEDGCTLELLELPGTFIPERWSFTFFEGLARLSRDFRDREVAELGCGNGWISLTLAKLWRARKVYGLDINPRAVVNARINFYLNALHDDGSVVVDDSGETLFGRLEFHESDLLSYCIDNAIRLDRIVGCIPQVLNPDPEQTLRLVSETDENACYNLGNYCERQGYVEDQFGLGLVARAVEESIFILRPSGFSVFNMGGRPGRAVLERLFERRGFRQRLVWAARVQQAADTDIQALVDIERNGRMFRFEFFVGTNREEHPAPISARTAWAFSKAGGPISHALNVYEIRLRNSSQIQKVFKFLKRPEFAETRSALDLSFPAGPEGEAIAEEKIAFLAHLAEVLVRGHGVRFPLSEPAGSSSMRATLARFLSTYHGLPVSGGNIVVLPARSITVRNLLDLYRPSIALVDTTLAQGLPRRWLTGMPTEAFLADPSAIRYPLPEDADPVVLEVPRGTHVIVKLIRKLRPSLVMTALSAYELQTSKSFEELVEAARSVKARLVVDVSDCLDLSSSATTNHVFEYLAESPLPLHVALMFGLLKCQVYPDLRLCAVVTENQDLVSRLTQAAMLTYWRPPLLAQEYYQCLIHELLSFQFPDQDESTAVYRPTRHEADDPDFKAGYIGLRECVQRAFEMPDVARVAFTEPVNQVKTKRLNRKSKWAGSDGADSASAGVSTESHSLPSISSLEENYCNVAGYKLARLDGSENLMPAPSQLRQFIFESFCRQGLTLAETDPSPEVRELLARRLGIFGPPGHPLAIVLGYGVASLFAGLMAVCARNGGFLLYPTGAPGGYKATAQFYGVDVQALVTDEADDFKITPNALQQALAERKKDKAGGQPFLYFSAPVVDPTGAVYSSQEIADVVVAANKQGVQVILDANFFGLEHGAGGVIDIQGALQAAGGTPDNLFAVLGGTGRELAAAGLRFGFAALRDPTAADALWEELTGEVARLPRPLGDESSAAPHHTVRYAAKRTLALLVAATGEKLEDGAADSSSSIVKELEEQREELKKRATLLKGALEESGWKVLTPKHTGGYFLVAKPPADLVAAVSAHLENGNGSANGNGSLGEEDPSEAVALALKDEAGVLVNGPRWTGLPGYIRFSTAAATDFNEALRRLKNFRAP